MTSIAMFRQAGAAHILADGALYNLDGKIAAIGSKLIMLEQFRMIIGWAGRANPHEIKKMLLARRPVTQRHALAALPYVARDTVALNRRRFPEAPEPDLNLFVSIWLTEADHPACYILSTLPDRLPPLYITGSLMACPASVDFADPSKALGRAVDMNDRASFDPVHDGIALMEASRRKTEGWGGGGNQCFVGGFIELATATRDGISRRCLREWPADAIGFRIDPDATERPGMLARAIGHVRARLSPA